MTARASGCAAFAVLFLGAGVVCADIYEVRSSSGAVSFTDTPVVPEYRVVIREPVAEARKGAHWKDVARSEAAKKNLDPLLVKAVIHVESGENPDALSSKGAMGLMQLMPGTAKALGVKDPFKPQDNVTGGVKYLSQMVDRFRGRLDLALAAYNAGPSAVERFRGIPPYGETRNYVTKVMTAYRRLSEGLSLDKGGDAMDNPVSVAERE